MGNFSWKCKGCGNELCEGELVVLDGDVQTYDGYGGTAKNDGNTEPSGWHNLCYSVLSDEEKADKTPSGWASNQGFGPRKLEFMEGYDPNVPIKYTLQFDCWWYDDESSTDYRFLLTDEGWVDEIEWEKNRQEIQDSPEFLNLLANVDSDADVEEGFKLYHKKIEDKIGKNPEQNQKVFESVIVALLEPLPQLPEKCKEGYVLRVFGRQEIDAPITHWNKTGKQQVFGMVYEKRVENDTEKVQYKIGNRLSFPVKIKTLPDQKVPLYHDGEKIGYVNYSQFNDVRLQVAENAVKGVYVVFEGQKLEIKPDGSLSEWPSGFFDLHQKQLYDLVKLKRENRHIVP